MERYGTEWNGMERNTTGAKMPRTGITETQILAAIEALQARGEAVSKITVRKELGDTGSYGTISAFLQRWREQRAQEAPVELQPIPDPVQALFAKAWSAAQALAQAELAPQREALAQEQAALKADLVRAQAENDEAVRILEVQLEHQAAQLAEIAGKEQAAQARVAELAEHLGYLKAKLEAAEGAEAAARRQLKEKDAQVATLEARLQEAERSLKEAVRPAKPGPR
jgi:endonuclease/exonuclease/phosphatase (EEP) superfamily protein YafD